MNAAGAESPKPGQAVPRTVKVLGAVSFLNDISSEMLYPIVPIFLTSVLGAPVAVVGLIEGVAEATASFLKLVGGLWSDRIGKRKPLVEAGYGFSTVAKPIFAAAHAWPVVLVGRFLDRFGKGLRTSARDAWIADVTPPAIRGRSFGLHRMLDTLGAIAGPLITFAILTARPNEYRSLFIIAFIPGLLALLLLVIVAKEAARPRPLSNGPASLRGWRGIPKSFWIFVGFSAVFGLANSSDAFLILRGKSLGWSTAAAVLAYALYNTTYALGSYPAGILSDRIPRKLVMGAGLIIFAVTYVVIGLCGSATLLWPLFALYGVSVSLTEATSRALIADLVPKDIHGASYGVYGTAMSVASLAASAWFGFVWQFVSPAAAFIVSGALASVAAGGIVAMKRAHTHGDGTNPFPSVGS